MMFYNELRNEQARQIIDVEQVFSAYRTARTELEERFAGGMSWKEINGSTYLYRKVKGVSRSLGPKSEETNRAYASFHEGRERLRERVQRLVQRLDEMAPVNRALGIGRVPGVCARVLRQLDGGGLMGRAIDVVGTNALFAYERMAGVQVESGLLATGDVDLLFDARRKLKLTGDGMSSEGLLGLLRKADKSFASMGRRSYRAVNADGFMVDLIKPTPRDRFSTVGPASIGGGEDLHAVEIEGLAWLVNSPKHEVVVIDDRGYPLEMSVPDPRTFAMHKAWLSTRDDREPIKKKRDEGQARLVAQIVTERLPNLKFDSADLSAVPLPMRRAAEALLPKPDEEEDDHRMEPKW